MFMFLCSVPVHEIDVGAFDIDFDCMFICRVPVLQDRSLPDRLLLRPRRRLPHLSGGGLALCLREHR